jgi:Mn2+/Fe2+ NRAMP family transporter
LPCCGDEGTAVFAVFTAIIGFLATLVLTIVLMNELMPRAFAEWQRGSKNRLVLLGFCIFIIAWIGAYFGYLLGS